MSRVSRLATPVVFESRADAAVPRVKGLEAKLSPDNEAGGPRPHRFPRHTKISLRILSVPKANSGRSAISFFCECETWDVFDQSHLPYGVARASGVAPIRFPKVVAAVGSKAAMATPRARRTDTAPSGLEAFSQKAVKPETDGLELCRSAEKRTFQKNGSNPAT